MITRLETGSIPIGGHVKVGFKYLDPARITSGDIIGGVDGTTGKYKGVQCLLAAQSEAKVQPRILIAPGFTPCSPTKKLAR